MSVRDINLNRPEPLHTGGVYESRQASEGAAHGSPAATQASAVKDRVEISAAARAAAESEESQARKLDFARKAYDGAPGLDAKRTAEIQQRLDSGYYSQDAVVQQIARGVAHDVA